MTNIIVIEPHAIFRAGIIKLLSDIGPDIYLEGHGCLNLPLPKAQPFQADLVLLSVCVTDGVGELVNTAQKAYNPRAIILLSDESDLQPLINPLPPLVAGHILKSAAPEVVRATTRLVLAGGVCFPPSPSWVLIDQNKILGSTEQINEESEILGLTPRQYQVLVLLARGLPMKTVGKRLNISVATVKVHTEDLYRRLNVHNRNAAVYAAISQGAMLGWSSMCEIPSLAGNRTKL